MISSKIIRNLLVYLGIFIIIEVFSFLALALPGLNQLIFGLLVLFCLGLSFYKLEYGLLMVLAELFIGSMGHLFVLPLGGAQLPIRMALWLAVILVFSIKFVSQLIKEGRRSSYFLSLKNFEYKNYFSLFALFIVIGVVNAYFRGHALNLIFSDFNAWLYWLLLIPAIVIYTQKGGEEKSVWKNLQTIFLAAVIWLSLKTLFLLFVFTHNLSFAPDIYTWLRKTLVGEMTPTLSGWPRIFIQGQIYSGIAFFLVFFASLKKYKNIISLALAALFSSVILISFSRSFWVGLVAALIFSLFVIWRLYSWRKALLAAFWFLASFTAGFILIYLVAIFPYPKPGSFNADFINRVSNNNEAALASRWSLLPVLAKEIKKEPFLGQGYGATITYFSRDPRVLEKNPSGEYTTYAFEWGYFDLWLKIGLLGLLAYLLLVFQLIKKALVYGHKNNDWLLLGLSSGIIFLAATNFFTPYLNHPLGIGILLVGACLIRRDRVY
jgi:O-antigen ligase